MSAQRAGFADPNDRGLLITAASTVVSRSVIRELAELREAMDKEEGGVGTSGLSAAEKTTLKALRTVAAYRHHHVLPNPPLPGVARQVQIDYDVPQTFDDFEKYSGGTTEFVLLVPPSGNPNRIAQFKRLMDFCIRSARPSRGTRYIVFLSVAQPSNKGFSSSVAPFFQGYLEMEKMVQKSGIPFTILRSQMPFQNGMFDWVRGAASLTEPGNVITFKLPIGNAVWSPVATRTVARIAAHLFLSFPNPHMNRTYDIDGPELLSGLGLAQAASRGLGGVPIRYTNCTREEFVQFLIDSGNARNPAHLENVMAVLDAVAENRYSDTDANKIRELFGKWYAPRRIAENFDERKEEITRLLERAAPVNADNERHGEKAEVVDAFDPDHPSQRWWRPTPSRDVGIAMTAQQWNQLYGPQVAAKWREAARSSSATGGRNTFGYQDPKF